MVVRGEEFFSLQLGMSSTRMFSEGKAICGVPDTEDSFRVRVYEHFNFSIFSRSNFFVVIIRACVNKGILFVALPLLKPL